MRLRLDPLSAIMGSLGAAIMIAAVVAVVVHRANGHPVKRAADLVHWVIKDKGPAVQPAPAVDRAEILRAAAREFKARRKKAPCGEPFCDCGCAAGLPCSCGLAQQQQPPPLQRYVQVRGPHGFFLVPLGGDGPAFQYQQLFTAAEAPCTN